MKTCIIYKEEDGWYVGHIQECSVQKPERNIRRIEEETTRNVQ